MQLAEGRSKLKGDSWTDEQGAATIQILTNTNRVTVAASCGEDGEDLNRSGNGGGGGESQWRESPSLGAHGFRCASAGRSFVDLDLC